MKTDDRFDERVLTAAVPTTSAASQPLQQTAETTEPLLASALTVSDTTPTLADTSAVPPNDPVGPRLITHGVLVAVVNIPVEGS